MPNKYKRKAVGVRGLWTEEALKAAISDVKTNNMSIFRAAILHDISRKTLERRLKKNNDNEGKLISHIKVLQAHGFPLSIDDVRSFAYHFAEQLHLKHRFNATKEKAGYYWLSLFLSRKTDI
ncbi:hypothetical protein JTB14_031521 [Gonioctena quinquepunctata]|nr:hypothetical protein JTB14_031521 [Gonioctena quinquepunctata]